MRASAPMGVAAASPTGSLSCNLPPCDCGCYCAVFLLPPSIRGQGQGQGRSPSWGLRVRPTLSWRWSRKVMITMGRTVAGGPSLALRTSDSRVLGAGRHSEQTAGEVPHTEGLPVAVEN